MYIVCKYTLHKFHAYIKDFSLFGTNIKILLTFPPTQANLLFVITKLGYQDLGCIILSIEIHLSLEDKNTSTVAVGVSGCDVVVMPPATTNTNSSPYFYKTIVVVVLVLIANAIFHNKYFSIKLK